MIENDKLHRDTKKEDFRNNEIWNQCDLLIYTSTLSAGVDFNLKHFDKLYGIYSQQTSQANYFVQSLLRVRQFNLNTHEIYLLNHEENLNKPLKNQTIFNDLTCLDSSAYKLFDLNLNLKSYLLSKKRFLQMFSTAYVIDCLRILGFELTYKDINQVDLDENLNLINISQDSKIQIYKKYLTQYSIDYEWFATHIKYLNNQNEIQLTEDQNLNSLLYVLQDICIKLNQIGFNTKEKIEQFNNFDLDQKLEILKHYEKYSTLYKFFRNEINLNDLTFDQLESRFESFNEQIKMDQVVQKLSVNQKAVQETFIKLSLLLYFKDFINNLQDEKLFNPIDYINYIKKNLNKRPFIYKQSILDFIKYSKLENNYK